MENLFLFLATSIVLRVASPRLRRYIVCQGCSTLLHAGTKRLQVHRTNDGDKLYFNEYASDGVTYGIICVQMKQVYTLEKTEAILKQFMKRAQKPMHINCHSSMELECGKQHLSITDYWQDKAGIDWKVKGYTNGKILSLLYVKNITDTSVSSHDAYLNGFRFSAFQ